MYFFRLHLVVKHIHSSLKLTTISLLYKDITIQSAKSKMLGKKYIIFGGFGQRTAKNSGTALPSLGDLRKNKTK